MRKLIEINCVKEVCEMTQMLAVIIFLVMFALIIMEIWERHIVTLVSALMILVFVFGIGMHSLTAMIESLNRNLVFHLTLNNLHITRTIGARFLLATFFVYYYANSQENKYSR